MITAIPDNEITQLLIHQLGNFFTVNETEKKEIQSVYSIVKEKLIYCLEKSDNKYYSRLIGGVKETYFNPFHSVQYCIYLYYYSKAIVTEKEDSMLADKIYYLNKALNGCDLYHGIDLPKYWDCEHPLGSIMGRAKYSDGFYFYQGCTVGGNKGFYPTIGKNVWMYAYSQLIGNSLVGNNVILGANCKIKDQDIPSYSLVFGESPNLIIKSMEKEYHLF